MNQIVPILFLLFISLNTYADCTTKNSDAVYNIPALLVDAFPFDSESLVFPINQQILNGCDKPENIYLNSNFIGDNTSLSASSPFHLLNFEILNPGTTDASALEKAKAFVKANFSFIFTLKNNGSAGNVVPVLSSNTEYNIIPYTTNDPNNNFLYNGVLYSMGNEGSNGGRADGLQLRDLDFFFDTTIPPTSDVLLVLNNSILRFKLGNYRASYFHISQPENMYVLDANIEMRIPLRMSMPTCMVDLPSTLDLGTTTADLLNQNNQNNHSFDINIQCSIEMINNNFKLTVLDSYDVSNINSNGILTNSSTSDFKSNAVIQLINNVTNTPFQIGTQFSYFRSNENSSAHFTQKASAQLIKSATDTTNGHVEGQATFLFDYD